MGGGHMWSNRWVRVGAVALGFFLINGIARLVSWLTGPDDEKAVPSTTGDGTSDQVIAVIGVLAIVALMAGAAAFWAVRHPVGRVVADLGLATLGGTVLAMLVGPFLGGNTPFEEGVESFVLQFL